MQHLFSLLRPVTLLAGNPGFIALTGQAQCRSADKPDEKETVKKKKTSLTATRVTTNVYVNRQKI
jgi:hypothetical protein